MARYLSTTDEVVQVTEADLVQLGDPAHAEWIERNLDPDAVYSISLIGGTRLQQIRRKYVRQGFNPKTHAREDLPLDTEDNERLGRDVIDAVLVHWAGIKGADGVDLPCTTETKVRLPEPIKGSLVYLSGMRIGPSREQRADSFRRPDGLAGVVDHGGAQ
jgi:hypothetical protein